MEGKNHYSDSYVEALHDEIARLEAALKPFARWWLLEVGTPNNRYMSPGGAYPTHDEIRRAAELVSIEE